MENLSTAFKNWTRYCITAGVASNKVLTFSIFALLCLSRLLRENVSGNEVSKFSDALYYADPGWIPGYYPQGPDLGRRQWLFQTIIEPLLLNGGFLITSIVGRLVCFLLFAYGFAVIARGLKLPLISILLVVAVLGTFPSLVAGEWFFNGFEPKTISYGLVVLSLGYLLDNRRSLLVLAMFLGVATSFQALVGIYAAFSVAVVVMTQAKRYGLNWLLASKAVAVYFFFAVLAFRPILVHLFFNKDTAPVVSTLASSFIYVFIRTPHHLDPGSWPAFWWTKLLFYYSALIMSYFGLRRCSILQEKQHLLPAFKTVFVFALASMLPFLFGLVAAEYDRQGRILQYYLFRFGDVMLPLCSYLLLMAFLENMSGRRVREIIRFLAGSILLAVVFVRCGEFFQQLNMLGEFPGEAQGISLEWKEVCQWISGNTAGEPLFVVPPLGSETFPWLARRRMFGTFKQVDLSGGLREWYKRMSELARVEGAWPHRGFAAAIWLQEEYKKLTTANVLGIMERYGASYFVTSATHMLSLPVVFKNNGFIVYHAELNSIKGDL